MILITGTAEPLGREVAHQMSHTDLAYKLLVADADRARAEFGPDVELVVGEINDHDDLMTALDGVERAFFHAPLGPYKMIGEVMAHDVAVKKELRHVVRVSLPAWGHTPEIRAASDACRIENEIDHYYLNAGRRAPAHTILRPYHTMQAVAEHAAENGRISWPLGNAKLALVDRRDVAAVIVAVLNDDHRRKEYTLTGPEALTMNEVAQALAVGYQPTAGWQRKLKSFFGGGGDDDWRTVYRDAWTEALRNGGEAEPTSAVADILGRPPRTLPAAVREGLPV